MTDISVNGKRIRLGQRKNLKEAIKLRKDAEEKYYGEFRRKEQENDPRYLKSITFALAVWATNLGWLRIVLLSLALYGLIEQAITPILSVQ